MVPSVRPDLMEIFARSLVATPALDEWGVRVAWQAVSREDSARVHATLGDRLTGVMRLERRQYAYPLRVRAMTRWRDVDVWCHADDDFEFLPGLTDYARAVARAREPGVGCVSCGWVRSEAFLAKKQVLDEFVQQPVVNTGGGMVYGRHVVALLADNPYCPVAPYQFDDLQVGLTAYVNGLRNYRYRGSVLIHRILSPGGMKRSFAEREHARPPDGLLRLTPSKPVYDKDNNWLMPGSADLLPHAHELHRRNAVGA